MFVWPTPYRFDHFKDLPVRINRVTGAMEFLSATSGPARPTASFRRGSASCLVKLVATLSGNAGFASGRFGGKLYKEPHIATRLNSVTGSPRTTEELLAASGLEQIQVAQTSVFEVNKCLSAGEGFLARP